MWWPRGRPRNWPLVNHLRLHSTVLGLARCPAPWAALRRPSEWLAVPRGEVCFRPAVGKNFILTVADWDDLAKRGPALDGGWRRVLYSGGYGSGGVGEGSGYCP